MTATDRDRGTENATGEHRPTMHRRTLRSTSFRLRRMGEPGAPRVAYGARPVRASSPSGATPPGATTAKACRRTPKSCGRSRQRGGLCGKSSDKGDTSTWCGMGWTGQPSVWDQGGKTWVVRCVRLRRALGRRPDGRAFSPTSRQATSSRVGHRRSRWVPPPVHGLARQLLPRHRDGSRPTDRVVQDLGL